MDLDKVKAKHNLRFCLELMITSLFGSIIFFILESVFSNFASIVFKVLAISLLGISFLAFATLVVLIAELCLRKHSIAINKKKEKLTNIVQTTISSYSSDSMPLMNSSGSQQGKFSSNSYQNSSVSETSFQNTLSTSFVFTQNSATSKSTTQHSRLLKIFKDAAVSTFANKKVALKVHGPSAKSSNDPEDLPLAVIDWIKSSNPNYNVVGLKAHQIKSFGVDTEKDSVQLLTNIPLLTKERTQKISRSKSCNYPKIKATTAYYPYSAQSSVSEVAYRSEFITNPIRLPVPELLSKSECHPYAHSSKVIARSESCPYATTIIDHSKISRAESFPSSPLSSDFIIS